MHVTVSELEFPSATFPVQVSASASVRGDACTKPIDEAAVSALVNVDVTYLAERPSFGLRP